MNSAKLFDTTPIYATQAIELFNDKLGKTLKDSESYEQKLRNYLESLNFISKDDGFYEHDLNFFVKIASQVRGLENLDHINISKLFWEARISNLYLNGDLEQVEQFENMLNRSHEVFNSYKVNVLSNYYKNMKMNIIDATKNIVANISSKITQDQNYNNSKNFASQYPDLNDNFIGLITHIGLKEFNKGSAFRAILEVSNIFEIFTECKKLVDGEFGIYCTKISSELAARMYELMYEFYLYSPKEGESLESATGLKEFDPLAAEKALGAYESNYSEVNPDQALIGETILNEI